MSEVDPRSDGKNGASPPAGAPPSEPPPPSSRREFIGTNTDAAQAYVPPTALPETPEPPVPDTKIALADEVDPRKAPTHPNLRKAAQALASERPPPTVEAPPDSQVSGIRRGSGYAPSRSQFPQPAPSSPRLEALRQTPSKPPTKASLHKTPSTPLSALRQTPSKPLSRSSLRGPPSESAETPQQRRAAIALIFVFAALLAVAVYFFLRRAPSPPGMDSGAPSASSGAPSSAAPPASSATSTPAAIEPSSTGAAPANATPAPAVTSSNEPSSNEPAPTARAVESASSAVTTTAPTASTQATPTASSTASPAVSGTGGKKSDRWF